MEAQKIAEGERTYDTLSGAKIHFRSVYSQPRENFIHIEEFATVGNAPSELMWKADATKK